MEDGGAVSEKTVLFHLVHLKLSFYQDRLGTNIEKTHQKDCFLRWNIGGVHPTSMSDAGVYIMKSADGLAFKPMFTNRSLDWSDTKNVMWWDNTLGKYVAYIRIDNPSPDMHLDHSCPDPWLPAGRRVGRCLIDPSELHDWSLAGTQSIGTAALAA